MTPRVVVALDTAGPVIGVALTDGTRVLSRTERVARGSEERLHPWIVALLAEGGWTTADLVGVAVAVGPGAFTGLRVGLAAGAGLAMALGLPVWPCSSLRSRAAAAGDGEAPLLVMLDARKGRVYAEVWEGGASRVGPADLAPAQALAWVAGRSFLATGEGALVYGDDVRAAGGRVLDDADQPGVEALATLAVAALARGEGLAPERVEPVYLREADAALPAGRR